MELVCKCKGNDAFSMQSPTSVTSILIMRILVYTVHFRFFLFFSYFFRIQFYFNFSASSNFPHLNKLRITNLRYDQEKDVFWAPHRIV